MSQFDRYTTTEYVEALRKFLNVSKKNFLREAGFVENPDEPRKGRLPRYSTEPLSFLERLVNEKAARCEAKDTTIGERFRLARDYKGLSDAQLARELGVSRELVRRWGADMNRPSSVEQLATLLDVPVQWLEVGGEEFLAANSYLGVRVGEEAKVWREKLYALTLAILDEVPENDDPAYLQAYMEWAVFNKPEMAQAARRAGGRWHFLPGLQDPLFAPWIPIEEHEFGRRLWSDEVEAIINEELARNTVYGAHAALKARCEAMGLGPDEYPKRISLHKRIEKERNRVEKFGVNLNPQIAAAVEKYFGNGQAEEVAVDHDATVQ
ncbi:helix-turn-helix transcriptional regulator [Paraburkholderia aspalathi]|nr:helix-turn-helix transcriptional regulator [Paraburkholderia aspalathi]MBK3779897.1 helix-turn-helix transcriptional regulator [Paraburkholderia aspalathi]